MVVPSSSSSVSSSSSYAGPQGEDESATLERTKLSKERNREHAKKTRLRKKAFMDQLKSKVMVLQREAAALQQKLEERQTASILLTFSGTSSSSASSSSASISSSSSSALSSSSSSSSFVPIAADDNEYSRGAGSDSERSVSARATRGHSTAGAAISAASAADASGPGSGELSPTALKGNIIEQLRTKVRREAKQAPPALLLPPPSSLLQKRLRSASVTSQSGDEGDVYDDDLDWDGQGEEDAGDDGAEQSTTPRGASAGEDLASYKKERNRMHAKLTRDRKKLFTCRLQQMIGALERQNADMRRQLVDDAPGHDREPSSSSWPPPMPASPQLGASPDPSS